jgi:DNA phosphorothioation system restriction enzyme
MVDRTGRLVTLELGSDYRSATHVLGRDFLGRVLPEASSYDRAVGFFSSGVFSVAPDEFCDFFERGNRMRAIASPSLAAGDVSALHRAIANRPEAANDKRPLAQIAERLAWPDLLCALIVRRQLHLRFARPTGSRSRAIYHEKIGLFADSSGRVLAFSGSANESRAAWRHNFERIDVFPSWRSKEESDRSARIRMQFQSLWEGDTPGLEVIDLPEAILEGALEPQPEGNATAGGVPRAPSGLPRIDEALVPPSHLELYTHQVEAIDSWGRAGGRGILEMATGSGKTITALSLAAHVHERIARPFCILVVAPFVHLVDQWITVARSFGLRPIRCAVSRSHWQAELSAAVNSLNTGRRGLLSVVTTGATLCTDTLQELMSRVRCPILIIADECHNYGAPNLRAALPSNASLRLGLSATPDRWMDDEGSSQLKEYFGPVAYKYGLKEALDDGVLTPYRYHPIVVGLEDDELEEYQELTTLLGRYLSGDMDGPVGDSALRLLLKRARLIASARSKLPRLRLLLQSRRDDSHMLIYCGDGQVEGPEPEGTLRQVEATVRMIGHELGIPCASYTYSTPPSRRQELLQLFAAGDVQALVAIRCLDEGVDIPATRTAFILASSTNPRQFIQRRGRVLRSFPGKTRASIYDFFVAPPIDEVPESDAEYAVVRRLIGNQIRRAAEFANLAENGPQARRDLLELTSHFKLHAEWGKE